MANIVKNYISVKGSAKDILSLINLGLKNSGVDELSADNADLTTLKDAVKTLCEKGTFRMGDGKPFEKGGVEQGIKVEKGVCFSTFLPIPDTFLKFDTTNYKDTFADEAAKQKKEYGVVGWYDYNCAFFGCKWDSEFDTIMVNQSSEDEYVLEMNVETAWSPSVEFFVRLSKLFPTLAFYGGYVEEFGQLVGYYKVVGGKVLEDVDKTDVFNKRQEEEDYDEAYDLFLEEYSDFIID